MSTVTKSKVRVKVLKGKVLGVNVYRGFARLCDLANISKADVFDQKNNPTGTQRDLSPKHAREAYSYVKHSDVAFWSEVFLCVRSSDVLKYVQSKGNGEYGELVIDYKKIQENDDIAISRVDGNHRLHFAGGEYDSFPAITKEVSFCLAYELDLKDEISLFRDINNNQRRMNTSHLDNIDYRLSEEAKIKARDVHLYIAKKLGEDKKSPFYDIVYEGGKKPGGHLIALRSLKTGLSYLFSSSTKLPALSDPDAQYTVIRNFFNAAKKWSPESWSNPKDYLMLRGAGLWGLCFIGAFVIDRCLDTGEYSEAKMLKVLKSGLEWDWSNDGHFAGLSGRGGAKKMSELVTSEFSEAGQMSIKALAKKILDSD